MDNNNGRIVVIYYSQTNSLLALIKEVLDDASNEIVYVPIKTKEAIHFPFKWGEFFDLFIDTVTGKNMEILYDKFEIRQTDIIILGFQPWFAHLSLPILSFFQSEYFKMTIGDKNIILFTCCRNTYINALYRVRNIITNNHGKIIGEIVIKDEVSELKSSYSFVRWLFTGKNNPFHKMTSQILKAKKILNAVLINGKTAPHSAHKVDIMKEEKIVSIFKWWGNFITKSSGKTRDLKLLVFEIWLLFSVIFILPFTTIYLKHKHQIH